MTLVKNATSGRKRRYFNLYRSILVLPVMVAAALLVGCGSNPPPEPAVTPDIDATVDAKASQALGTPIAQPTRIRSGRCGRLCDVDFWRTAGVADVQDELDRGADIAARDGDGSSPLHGAAEFNTEPAVIALLLDRGADIEARDGDGLTPLHGAAGFNTEPGVIALLLDRGADIAARDDVGSSPLHGAAEANTEPAVIALLLDRGADIEARDGDGWTPLHWAAANNTEPAVIALLLDRGADIAARDGDGSSPLHWAAEANTEPAVIALLLDRGADIADARDVIALCWTGRASALGGCK